MQLCIFYWVVSDILLHQWFCRVRLTWHLVSAFTRYLQAKESSHHLLSNKSEKEKRKKKRKKERQKEREPINNWMNEFEWINLITDSWYTTYNWNRTWGTSTSYYRGIFGNNQHPHKVCIPFCRCTYLHGMSSYNWHQLWAQTEPVNISGYNPPINFRATFWLFYVTWFKFSG